MTGTLSQLADSQNLVYLTNVTLNGAPLSVMIDTGRYASFHHGRFPQLTSTSSDLWVSPPVPNAVPENYHASVSYASGSASGDCTASRAAQRHLTVDVQ